MKTTDRKSNCDTFLTPDRRPIPDTHGEWVAPKFGMHYLGGNQRPYFSLTGTIYGPARYDNSRLVEIGGGCCHDTILRAFPELADLVPWHLCDDRGVPMHYVENAVYWLELSAGISRWQKTTAVPHGHKTFNHVLCRHVLADVLDDRDKPLNYALRIDRACGEAINLIPTIIGQFKTWLEGRLPALKEQFDRTMAKHGVEQIAVVETPAA